MRKKFEVLMDKCKRQNDFYFQLTRISEYMPGLVRQDHFFKIRAAIAITVCEMLKELGLKNLILKPKKIKRLKEKL